MAAGQTDVTRTVAFLLSKAKSLEWSGWKSEAREFLDSQPEKFDVRELFIENQWSWSGSKKSQLL